jgi:hypothetical protein
MWRVIAHLNAVEAVKGSNRAAYLGLRGLHVNIGDKAQSYKTRLVVGLT